MRSHKESLQQMRGRREEGGGGQKRLLKIERERKKEKERERRGKSGVQNPPLYFFGQRLIKDRILYFPKLNLRLTDNPFFIFS